MDASSDVTTIENNLGVAFLEKRDLKNALAHLSCALRSTMVELTPARLLQEHHRQQRHQQQLESTVAPGRCRSSSIDSVGSLSSFEQTSTLPSRSTVTTTTSKSESEKNSSSTTFVYGRGINLIPCSTAYSPDFLRNRTIVSAIVIFNLSIVYHLKGLESCSLSSLRLRKAKALYLKSQGLLIDAGVPMGATGNPVIDVLSMALLNNLGHVAFELSNYDDSRAFFDFLVRFTLTVVPSTYGDSYVASLLDQQKSSFLLNAFILQAPKLASAA